MVGGLGALANPLQELRRRREKRVLDQCDPYNGNRVGAQNIDREVCVERVGIVSADHWIVVIRSTSLRRISYSTHSLALDQSSTAVSACATMRVTGKPNLVAAF